MSELYARVLLWHKLICSTTGGLALCSVKHRLNRDEAQGWAATLRNVADEIEAVLAGHGFILDDKGRRVVQSSGYETARGPMFFTKGGTDVDTGEKIPLVDNSASGRKAGGVRIATRKKL